MLFLSFSSTSIIGLSNDFLNDASLLDSGKLEIEALMTVRKAFVFDSTQVHQCRLQVSHLDRILGNVKGKIVAAAVDASRFDPAAGHPNCKRPGMMIASMSGFVVDVALHERRASKFATPNHQRVVEQAAVFQVRHQCGTRLVGVLTLNRQLIWEIPMLVPTGMH